jgi:hypothetical protein
MNSQNFTEKFPISTPHEPEGVELHWDDQLIVIKNPLTAEWASVDYPIHLWHDVSPRLRILVVTSDMPLAQNYCHLSRRIEPPSPRTFKRNYVTNEAGGTIYYTSPAAMIGGRQFDKVIISDPKGHHSFDERIGQWLNESVRCRLMPSRYFR